MRIQLFFTLTLLLALFSCNSANKELKPIQEVNSGEYKVTILSETGSVKQGTGTFQLEFRKAADNQLVDVGRVEVSPVMEMAGMGPMIAGAEVTTTEIAGRYKVSSNFTMAGLWRCQVKFGDGQSIRFNLNAQ